MRMNWLHIGRDILIVWVLTGVGGFIAALAYQGSQVPLEILGISNMLMGVIAFCFCGCLTPTNRWKHLLYVAIGAWLASIVNIFIREDITLITWAAGIFILLVMMLVGGGLSFIFVRTPEEHQGQDTANDGEAKDDGQHG